jgi:hypothetical protein
MELSEAIKTAHNAVVQADLPPNLQGVAFGQVLRHLLEESSRPSGGYLSQRTGPTETGDTTGLGRLAGRVGVSASALADLFEIGEGSASLHVASSRIASTKSQATREIALLIASARQGSGIDETWTAVEHVREALQHYKRYDTNNFSAYLKGIGDAFNFRGKGSSLEMRLTQPGWEMAIDLITLLAGASS